MRRGSVAVLGSVLVVSAVAVLVPSCVRLSDAGVLRCEDDSDCDTGKKCHRRAFATSSLGDCVDASYCELGADCLNGMVCLNQKCITPECTDDSVCGNFACNTYLFTCVTACNGSGYSECRQGFVCQNGTCEPAPPSPPPPPPPPLLQNGAACSVNTECQSSQCCGPATAKVCKARCLANGTQCTDASECAGGNCCYAQELAGKYCYPSACVLGQTDDPCVQDAYCANGKCIGGKCAPLNGYEGSSCSVDSNCRFAECCMMSNGTKECNATCPPLSGDYCKSGDSCPDGECTGASAFPTDGYCSGFCPGSCGVNSFGVRNECVILKAGSSHSSACKPGCTTTADCSRIHPNLVCWDGGYFKACDFDTSTWSAL